LAKSDFILLSDVRFVNSKGVKGCERIKRYLRNYRNRAYDLYHHSSGNGRGVAILIAMSLNIVINREWRDQAENAMVMDITSRQLYGNSRIYLRPQQHRQRILPVFKSGYNGKHRQV
jgi:hypothetical protein